MKKPLVFALVLLGLAQAAAAIPAFARKYGYSCDVCHAPVPRLKAFGEEFMDNGYRVPDKEPPRATVDTATPPCSSNATCRSPSGSTRSPPTLRTRPSGPTSRLRSSSKS